MIRVTTKTFDISNEITKLREHNDNIGAVVNFIGYVRGDKNHSPRDISDKIIHLRLEHYPEMTKLSLEEIEEEALSRFDIISSLIIHRYGKLKVGEPIVLVIATSSHRKAAFEAADYMMDQLKTRATFWKKQITKNNESWVEAKASDNLASSRWRSETK